MIDTLTIGRWTAERVAAPEVATVVWRIFYNGGEFVDRGPLAGRLVLVPRTTRVGDWSLSLEEYGLLHMDATLTSLVRIVRDSARP